MYHRREHKQVLRDEIHEADTEAGSMTLEYQGPERRGAGDRKLTEADIDAIKAAFSDHPCRFPSLTTEEVEDLRRVAHVTNKLGNRFIDGVSWAIGVAILAFIYLMVTHRLWPGGK